MTKPPTRLEDARAMKRMGAPLNTPVKTRTFSKDYSKHWFALMNAHGKFTKALFEFLKSEQAPANWRRVKRHVAAVDKAAVRCIDFCEALGGKPDKSEQDDHEYALMRYFIEQRALPFLDYWNDAIERIEAGEAFTLTFADMPRWTDEEGKS